MPNDQNCGSADLARYDAMTDEDLEALLRLDAQKPEGEETDLDTLLYIMEVLARRRRNSGKPGKTPEEAFASFQQNYYPIGEADAEADMAQHASAKRNAVKPRLPQWLRAAAAVAAVLVIVLFGSVTAKAFGVDVWAAVAHWTQETFHFGSGDQVETDGPGADDKIEYTSLQEALTIKNIPTSFAPTWFPDEYEFVDIKINEVPLQITILARYQNTAEQEIKVQIKHYINSDPEQIEQSSKLIEAYKSDGIIYYIFEDNNQLRAAWINGSYECYISGPLTVEEMKSMIDSISKG